MDRILDELENSAAPPVPASISFRTTNVAHSMIPSSMSQKTSQPETVASSEHPQGEIQIQLQQQHHQQQPQQQQHQQQQQQQQ